MIVERSKLARLTELADNRGAASLPVLQDLELWWKTWGPRIARDVGCQGWVLFLLDAQEKLIEGETLVSRIIRGKPTWDGAGTEAEWGNVETATARTLRWFETHAPAVKRDAPDWAQFVIAAQYNAFAVLARLGRELQGAIEAGHATVVLEQRDDGLACTRGGDRLLEEVA